MKAILLLLLAVPAHAHGGSDGGLHHSLPFLLVWLPFVKAAYDAGWRTVVKAVWHWVAGGGA